MWGRLRNGTEQRQINNAEFLQRSFFITSKSKCPYRRNNKYSSHSEIHEWHYAGMRSTNTIAHLPCRTRKRIDGARITNGIRNKTWGYRQKKIQIGLAKLKSQ